MIPESKIIKTSTVPPNSVIVSLPKKVEYFAHIIRDTGKIVGISQERYNDPDTEDLVIDEATAKDFFSGAKRIALWTAIVKKGKYELIDKKSLATTKFQRVEVLRMQEVGMFEDDDKDSDIIIEIGNHQDSVLIHYAIDKIDSWKEPVKLYFTAKGNPQILKCAFSLDVNIVEKIVEANNLTAWPNPIILKLPDSDDLAVYIARSNIKMSIKRHETSDN